MDLHCHSGFGRSLRACRALEAVAPVSHDVVSITSSDASKAAVIDFPTARGSGKLHEGCFQTPLSSAACRRGLVGFSFSYSLSGTAENYGPAALANAG